LIKQHRWLHIDEPSDYNGLPALQMASSKHFASRARFNADLPTPRHDRHSTAQAAHFQKALNLCKIEKHGGP